LIESVLHVLFVRAGMMWDFTVHVRYQHPTLMLLPTMALY